VKDGRAVVEDIGEVFGAVYASVDWFVGGDFDGMMQTEGALVQTWQFMGDYLKNNEF